jgi:glyoxalase family protein
VRVTRSATSATDGGRATGGPPQTQETAMTAQVQGLHHVTAIGGPAQRVHAFYARALGLRFVKKTVNFDDPGTYHLYYGDGDGSPGSAMTFFPWAGARRGRVGAGQVSLTQFAAPRGALPFWTDRLPTHGGRLVAEETVFGERRAVVEDPDGLLIALVETDDARAPWTTGEVGEAVAIRGFHGVTLALRDGAATAAILTEVFGYREAGTEAMGGGAVTRLRAVGDRAAVVDLHVDPAMPHGQEGAGTVHHVAFSVPDRAAQDAVRARMVDAGLRVTERIDRNYFWSIYARTPGGVLFEVATDEPGFAVDEPRESLGTALKLPPQHEPLRARIEQVLPDLIA